MSLKDGRLKRFPGAFLVLMCVLLLTACFEDPVEESLNLTFMADGQLWISHDTSFHDVTVGKDRLAFERRIADHRQALLDGRAPWNERFRSLTEPAEDLLEWRREEGKLKHYQQAARVLEPQVALDELLGSTPIQAILNLDRGGDSIRHDLSFLATGGDLASRAERQTLARQLAAWAAALADFHQATAELWSYSQAHPNRARLMLGLSMRDLVEDEELPGGGDAPLSDEETLLLTDSEKTQEKVLKLFEVASGETLTLQELSQRVWDPYPGRIEIELPSPALEFEGFVESEKEKTADINWSKATSRESTTVTQLTVPRSGLWQALSSLEGKWLSPDPLITKVESMRGQRDFDLDSWLDQEFFLAEDLPSANQLERALVEAVVPPELCRVVWLTPKP